jgi:hypothetical protein
VHTILRIRVVAGTHTCVDNWRLICADFRVRQLDLRLSASCGRKPQMRTRRCKVH